MFRYPAKIKEYSAAVQYTFDTSVAQVYALQKDGDETWEVHIVTKGDDGLTAEQVDAIVSALHEIS